jgi:hypothetical protein
MRCREAAVAAVVLLLLALHGGEGADGDPFKQPLAGRDLHNHSPARDVQAESPRPVLRGWPAVADLSTSPGLCCVFFAFSLDL